jgi:hypothetical protein
LANNTDSNDAPARPATPRRQGRVLAAPGGQPLPNKPADTAPPTKEGAPRRRGAMRRDTKADDRPTYLAPDGTTTYWSVTSLINQAVDPEPLILWAHRQGRARKSLHESRQAARDGTSVHKLIERAIGTADPPTATELAAEPDHTFNAFDAWRCWMRANPQFRVLATEAQVVHDGLGVGGCIDCLGMYGDIPVIADWKTSRGTYPEHVAQVAAYAMLLGGGRPNLPHAEVPFVGQQLTRAIVVRLPKDGGDAEAHWLDETALALGAKVFLGARETVLGRLAIKKILAAHGGITGDLGAGLLLGGAAL